MAANAYVLITVEPAKTEAVGKRLQAIPGALVREVFGPYDFVVELETDSEEDLTATIRHKIRPVSGITSTVTCIWF